MDPSTPSTTEVAVDLAVDLADKVDSKEDTTSLSSIPHTERLITLMNSVEQHFMAHMYSAWIFPMFDKMIKVPITLLTLLTGTSMWSSRALTPEWFLALATIQGIIITLMIIQFYYEFETRAHRHSMNATQLANLYRRLCHQWFKHERRSRGLPPWGIPMGSSVPVVATDLHQIHYKWMMFFERIETEYKDVQEQYILPWVTRQIERWTSYSTWIRYSIFLYFHSFITPLSYTLPHIISMSQLTKQDLLQFIQWYRSKLFMTPRIQVTYLTMADLQCMNKQLLLYHFLIELNIPMEHFVEWNGIHFTSLPRLQSCCSCCAVSTCNLFLCWIREADILPWYQNQNTANEE